MVNATPRETAFLICLSESYELAGRKVSDSTIISAAREMAERIPCRDEEIKELFAVAKEYNDIPTVKTLWKAWQNICDSRPVVPSATLTYDGDNAFLRRINYRLTLALFAYKIGRYAEFCKAYETQKMPDKSFVFKNPNLKDHFDHEVIPFLEKVCGRWIGTNPNHPDHPIRSFKWSGTSG